MLFTLAQTLGLVKLSKPSADSIKPRYEQGSLFEQWSQTRMVDQTHDLLEYWLKSQQWTDIAGVNFDPSSSYYLDVMAGCASVSFLFGISSPATEITRRALFRIENTKEHSCLL